MIQGWSRLAQHYDDAAGYMSDWKSAHAAMASLCRYIEASPMKDCLFGHQSMHMLRIAQIEYTYPPDPTIPWLTIEPVDANKIEFRYVDTQLEDRQWHRVVGDNVAIERFKKTIRQLGWYSSELL